MGDKVAKTKKKSSSKDKSGKPNNLKKTKLKSKPKTTKKVKTAKAKSEEESVGPIIIDEEKGLVFQNEEELYAHFEKQLLEFEEEYQRNLNAEGDIKPEDIENFEEMLVELLADPDEVWKDVNRIENVPVMVYTKEFDVENFGKLYYVALVYLANDMPTFVFLHFPTKDKSLAEYYKKGEVYYQRDGEEFEVDALAEGDELAVGLFEAMLTIRSEKDIPQEDFAKYFERRDSCIEEPDEIWRYTDFNGNILVNFIKDLSKGSDDLYYIAVAIEDKPTDSHYLLFSFPTNDKNLVDRYCHGESLHSEDDDLEEGH